MRAHKATELTSLALAPRDLLMASQALCWAAELASQVGPQLMADALEATSATVTVLAPENDESFELSAEEEGELLAALDEANAGRLVSGAEVLREIGRPR